MKIATTKQPIDAVLAITYGCNAKCEMCDIWKLSPADEMKPEDYLRLPKGLKYINISGGEPFLRTDIVDIVRNVKKACPKANIIISSNGFLTDRIEKSMREILKIDPKVGIAISIDGIGEKHGQVRGVPGAYEKALATVGRLKDMGMGKRQIRIAFTLSDMNTEHFSRVYDLSEELDVQFTCALAQTSPMYFGGKENKICSREESEKQFDHVINKMLKAKSLKSYLRAYFVYGLKYFALNGKSLLKARPAEDIFFMDPQGNIYPSVMHSERAGNITEKGFDKIWSSEETAGLREKIVHDKKDYWMVCAARTAMRRNWPAVMKWIIKNKLC